MRCRLGPNAATVRLSCLFGRTAARQGDTEANFAEGRCLTALNGIGQDGLERPIALRQDRRTNLRLSHSGLRQAREDMIDALFHQLTTAFRLRSGRQGCTECCNGDCRRECGYRGSDVLPLMPLHVCGPALITLTVS